MCINTDHHYPLLINVSYHEPSIRMLFHDGWELKPNHYYLIIMKHYQPSYSAIDHRWSSLIVTNHHQSLSDLFYLPEITRSHYGITTVIHHLSWFTHYLSIIKHNVNHYNNNNIICHLVLTLMIQTILIHHHSFYIILFHQEFTTINQVIEPNHSWLNWLNSPFYSQSNYQLTTNSITTYRPFSKASLEI